MALLSLDRHDVLEAIRQSNGLHEAFLRVAKLPAVGEYKTLTNADRIRAMADEELDGFLNEVQADAYLLGFHASAESRFTPYGKRWLEWLKQEAKDET